MLSSFRGASIFLALASCLFHQTVVAETINGNTAADMCSSLNTASSGNGNYSMYQTQGLCTNWCREEDSSNAYAIVQYQYCWCSTVAPGSDSIVNNSDCNTQCPGYTEWCGSKSDHLYGYMEIGPLPVSTMDASTSSTSTSSSTSSTTSSTSTSSSTSEPTTTTTESTTSSSISSSVVGDTPLPTSASLPETPTLTLTSSRTQSTSVQTTTDSAGVIMTVTTIATAAPESTGKGGGGSNTGMIVGVTVGISAALVMAIAGLFWYKWRRRNEAMESESKIGFRDSSGKGIESGFASPGRRDSRMMPMDPRMEDPYSAAFRRESQDSIGTLRDEQDYSRRVHQPQPRVLRAVNPDPENE